MDDVLGGIVYFLVCLAVTVAIIWGLIWVIMQLTTHSPVTFTYNGNTVTCQRSFTDECGLHAWECNDNASYACITNMQYKEH